MLYIRRYVNKQISPLNLLISAHINNYKIQTRDCEFVFCVILSIVFEFHVNMCCLRLNIFLPKLYSIFSSRLCFPLVIIEIHIFSLPCIPLVPKPTISAQYCLNTACRALLSGRSKLPGYLCLSRKINWNLFINVTLYLLNKLSDSEYKYIYSTFKNQHHVSMA